MRNKILFIANSWLQEAGGGGVKSTVTKLLNNFSDDLFHFSLLDIEIGTDPDVIKTGHSKLDENIKFIPIHLPNIKLNRIYIPIWPLFIFRILSIIKKEKPVLLCYVTGPPIKVILFFLVKLFFPHIRQVFVEHIPPLIYIEHASHFRSFLRFFIPLVYKRVDAIVSVSQEMANMMVKELRLSSLKTCCIYNPIIDRSLYKKSSEPIKYPWYNEPVPIILSVGRLDPIQKDFPTLLKAFALILEKKPAKLIIVGDGSQRKELERLANRLNISNNVYFAGYQENPYKFMAKSDMLLLSSRFEAFGVVLVEAMACGTPVVASDCNFGPREIIQNGENGFLVPVGDVKKLSDTINQLLVNKELRGCFIKRGKETAKNFTTGKAVRAYQILFKELLKSKNVNHTYR